MLLTGSKKRRGQGVTTLESAFRSLLSWAAVKNRCLTCGCVASASGIRRLYVCPQESPSASSLLLPRHGGGQEEDEEDKQTGERGRNPPPPPPIETTDLPHPRLFFFFFLPSSTEIVASSIIALLLLPHLVCVSVRRVAGGGLRKTGGGGGRMRKIIFLPEPLFLFLHKEREFFSLSILIRVSWRPLFITALLSPPLCKGGRVL